MEEKHYDVVIIGGGPAGLTAGLFCGRAELRTLILEKESLGGQLLATELVDNYPGLPNITGAELAAKIESHARDFGVETRRGAVAEIYNRGREKVVRTEDGQLFRAGAIIVCAGGSPKKLGAAGEAKFTGRGVSYCAVCDGPFFRNKVVAVVGSGDSAVGEADYLTRFASKVYLITNRDRLDAVPLLVDRLSANPKVEFVWNTAVKEIGGNRAVEWIVTRDKHTGLEGRLDVAGVFIYVGFRPNSHIFPSGVMLDSGGYVVTGWDMETSQSGIYAAGDIRAQSTRQITNAISDGTTAAIKAYEHLHRARLLKHPTLVVAHPTPIEAEQPPTPARKAS
ncbi:MAG: FAD-dependent oxidoreductase [Chloroflexi bacterium]|nr:FAD-dependent oxidoreductase [Chloroflexota bacterium]